MGDVEAKIAAIEQSQRIIEQNQNEFKAAVIAIQGSIERLVRLEERHAETREALARAFTYAEKLEERVEVIEKVIPGLVEMRGWLVKANLGILGFVGLAILGVVIIK